jgi:hypothetical protein
VDKETGKRSYKHEDPKLNKEIEKVNKRISAAFTEAKKQHSVVNKDSVDEKIPQGVFHINRDGEIFIRTKLGLKQLQFV